MSDPSSYSDFQLRIGAFLVGGLLCLLIATALLVSTTFAGETQTTAEAPAVEEERPAEAGPPLPP